MSGLERFVEAQEGVYETALAELRAGEKRGHWIWFIFPQHAGLGHSLKSRHFGIESLQHANAYLGHPLLCERLVECTGAMLGHEDRSAEVILGPLDALKFRSSMTLFDRIMPNSGFAVALDKYFGGVRDERTVEMIGPPRW